MIKKTTDLTGFTQEQIREIYILLRELETMDEIERNLLLKTIDIYRDNTV
jgi:hypothetical protein